MTECLCQRVGKSANRFGHRYMPRTSGINHTVSGSNLLEMMHAYKTLGSMWCLTSQKEDPMELLCHFEERHLSTVWLVSVRLNTA